MNLWVFLLQRTQEIPVYLSADGKGESRAKKNKKSFFPTILSKLDFDYFSLWETDSYLRILRPFKDLIL